MNGIGGNTLATIQIRTGSERNEIGEIYPEWHYAQTIKGWLDLASGDSRYTTYYAKVQESTHIFIADYVELDSKITAESSRMVINGRVYDIMLIDNPMGMNEQLEIYLKYTGGQ